MQCMRSFDKKFLMVFDKTLIELVKLSYKTAGIYEVEHAPDLHIVWGRNISLCTRA